MKTYLATFLILFSPISICETTLEDQIKINEADTLVKIKNHNISSIGAYKEMAETLETVCATLNAEVVEEFTVIATNVPRRGMTICRGEKNQAPEI